MSIPIRLTPNMALHHSRGPLGLGIGGEEVVRILQERDHISSETTDPGGQAPPQLSVCHEGESLAEIQFRADDPNANITDLPSADPGEHAGIPNIHYSISKSTDNVIPSAEPSTPPRSPSMWPRSSRTHQAKPTPPPTPDQPSRLLSAAIIASSVCLLEILVYIVPSFLPYLSSFHE
ncbi:hypothetical protein HOY80DRAFT_1068966 [Tuber brumale]|nr:hypothetical protein HOY80DRAFT_1068966 [Tuber brumale]